MKKIFEIFNRMGVSGINDIVDPAVLEIIYEFDKSPNVGSLAKVILDIYGVDVLLDDKTKLNEILKYLTESDARELLNDVGGNSHGATVWERLASISFRRSNNKKILYEYFGLEFKEDNKQDDVGHHIEATEVISPSYSLFPHQETAARKVKNILVEKRNSRVLLHMPTGAGKTRTSMNVVSDYFRNYIHDRDETVIIWLADTEELCDQAAEEFIKAWEALGVGEICLHRFYGEYDQNLSGIETGFLIAGLAKLNQRLNKDQSGALKLGRATKLIIFDEAHKILAPTYQHIVELFQSTGGPSLLGLSATPGRATFDEDENVRFAEFFDRRKITLEVEGYSNPVNYLQDNGYIANACYHELPYEPKDLELTKREIEVIANKDNIPESVLSKLGVDTKRNIKILNAALDEVAKGKRIILFACSVGNAEAITALLKYKDIKTGLVTSKTPSETRRKVIQDYKTGELDIIVNYGVLTTGFDAPCTNVAIIARPTNSLTLYSQMVGRAARGKRAGGNDRCDIYTVIDALPGFTNMSEAFEHWDDAWG
ncbi:MAG: DEAD/DEAH box helicase [Gammaproteobacteria bacterium]